MKKIKEKTINLLAKLKVKQRLKDITTKPMFFKVISLILFPIVIFLYSQFFCNGKFIFEPGRMLLNFIFIYYIICIFYIIFGKIKLSLYISMIFIFIIRDHKLLYISF